MDCATMGSSIDICNLSNLSGDPVPFKEDFSRFDNKYVPYKHQHTVRFFIVIEKYHTVLTSERI